MRILMDGRWKKSIGTQCGKSFDLLASPLVFPVLQRHCTTYLLNTYFYINMRTTYFETLLNYDVNWITISNQAVGAFVETSSSCLSFGLFSFPFCVSVWWNWDFFQELPRVERRLDDASRSPTTVQWMAGPRRYSTGEKRWWVDMFYVFKKQEVVFHGNDWNISCVKKSITMAVSFH